MCPLFIESHQKRSTCSQSATDRGLKQKVISYSFYGPLTSAYFNGIFENLAGVKMYYPGYVMRLYLNRLKAIADNQGFMQSSLTRLWLLSSAFSKITTALLFCLFLFKKRLAKNI